MRLPEPIIEAKAPPIIDPNRLPSPDKYAKQRMNDTPENWLSKLTHEFHEICPEIYKHSDLSHHGMPPQRIIDQVLAWKFSKGCKGLVLQGNTGKCKTRLAWHLIRRTMTTEGNRVRAITDPSFSREYSRRLGNGTADEWMENLTRAPILFIDDFGKAAVTPRYKEQFYDVLETRTNMARPLIITTQLNRDSIVHRFGDEDGKAVVRRILDFADLVNFGK